MESVKEYKEKDYEIIIVNDGSKDRETIKILRELKKQGCNIINQKNKGPSTARNNGIKKAKGKYLLLLDADNKIKKEYIIEGIKILNDNKEVGVVYSDVGWFGEKKWIRKLPDFNFSPL